jgi:rubrerythrin
MSHHHHHPHETEETHLTFQAKLKIRLDHWIQHNDDHTDGYREWARQAAAADLTAVARLLEEVADMSAAMSEKFKQALQALESEGPPA